MKRQLYTPHDESRRDYLLYVGAFLALLPGLILRDFTPANELRYLSIADEALRNHTFFTFTNHGVPYADKPPMYLWLVMLCKWITGRHMMWLLSLISLLPAFGILHIMNRWVRQELNPAGRHLAQVILLTCGYFLGAAIILRMDMLMTLFIVLAFYTFWQMSQQSEPTRRQQWIFPIYLFLALFTKGPLGLLMPLCGTLVYLISVGKIRHIGRYWGWRTWCVLLAGCVLWFGAVYLEGGTAYLNNLLFHQTVDRAVHSFHHEKPFYFYLISIWYSLAPWSPLVVFGLLGLLLARRCSSALQRYFLTIGLTTLVLVSCISSKLDIYLLPAYPFLVYSAALALPSASHPVKWWIRVALTIPAVVFFFALPGLSFAARQVDYLQTPMLYVAAGVLSLSGIYCLYKLYTKHSDNAFTPAWHKAALSLGYGLLLTLFVGGWAMPQLNRSMAYGALSKQALVVAQQNNITDFYTWRLSRPDNVDVYLSSEITVLPNEDVPAMDPSRGYIILTKKQNLEHFPQHETQIIGAYGIVIHPARK